MLHCSAVKTGVFANDAALQSYAILGVHKVLYNVSSSHMHPKQCSSDDKLNKFLNSPILVMSTVLFLLMIPHPRTIY